MPRYRVEATEPGDYNDGDGHIYIYCLDNATEGQKIIQRNCNLTNRQAVNVYTYLLEHKYRVMPIVHKVGGPNTYITEDKYLSLLYHDAKDDKTISVRLSDLPEAENPDLAKALYETKNEALSLQKSEPKTKLSIADIKKISDGKGPR